PIQQFVKVLIILHHVGTSARRLRLPAEILSESVGRPFPEALFPTSTSARGIHQGWPRNDLLLRQAVSQIIAHTTDLQAARKPRPSRAQLSDRCHRGTT